MARLHCHTSLAEKVVKSNESIDCPQKVGARLCDLAIWFPLLEKGELTQPKTIYQQFVCDPHNIRTRIPFHKITLNLV